MRWDVLPAEPRQIALAQALLDTSARQGWSERAMTAASTIALGSAEGWRELFPRGARDAIWFISEVSDASMRSTFTERPPTGMATVIDERFEQNSDLKPFVRRVMVYDLLHPLQAIGRMQRTARVMASCLAPSRAQIGPGKLTLLNLVYTMLVFHWLFDRTAGDSRTRRATRSAMRWLDL